MKALPITWFDKLADILVSVEELGVWPAGLLDAYIAIIPKADGDASLLGQRPLCVLPVAYHIWASASMHQLEHWFQSFVSECVFSAGGGKSPVEVGTALHLRRFSQVWWITMYIHLLQMLLSLFTLWIEKSCMKFFVAQGCLPGSAMFTF